MCKIQIHGNVIQDLMFLHTTLNLNIYYSVISIKWFSGYHWYWAQIPFSGPAHSPPVAMRMAAEGSQLTLSFKYCHFTREIMLPTQDSPGLMILNAGWDQPY